MGLREVGRRVMGDGEGLELELAVNDRKGMEVNVVVADRLLVWIVKSMTENMRPYIVSYLPIRKQYSCGRGVILCVSR